MKKFLFLSLVAVAMTLSSCSGSGSDGKIDVKQEAVTLNKSMVETIDKTQVTTREEYDALKMKLDSMETVYYETYKYKADSLGMDQAVITDTVRAEFDKTYREKINKALDAKQKNLEQEQAK